MKYDSIKALVNAGISYDDAQALRRISMTLDRWHELECGDSNDYASWTIARGKQTRIKDESTAKYTWHFEYNDNGKPYIERHSHSESRATYTPTPDRERGALKRLAAIMARYPGFAPYVQGDPRGCALYIIRPGDVREGASLDSCYSNGVAVCK